MTENRLTNWWRGFRTSLAHAFAIKHEVFELTEADQKLIVQICYEIRRRRMAAPAIIALEIHRPLQAMGPYAIQFFYPFVTMFLKKEFVDHLTSLFEKPITIDRLIELLEAQDEDFEQVRKNYKVGEDFNDFSYLRNPNDSLDLNSKAPLDGKSLVTVETPKIALPDPQPKTKNKPD